MVYCRICENHNANHKEAVCPQGIDLYHGTRVSSISSIIDGHANMAGGLRPTIGGRIGDGIYFAQQNEATEIAAHRGNGTGVAVLKCRVNPKKCVTGEHPAWVVKYPFKQWCLKGSNYRITHVFIKDGTVQGSINDPQVSISFGGSCTLSGNVNVDTIYIG